MESRERQPEQREPELHRPDEAVEDLEPDETATEQVKGGEYLKITMQDVHISS